MRGTLPSRQKQNTNNARNCEKQYVMFMFLLTYLVRFA